jgi:hypothetical protein
MVAIRVQVLGWIDDAQPGWVECSLVDARGKKHRFREKAPVVSSAGLHAGSQYPQPGIIGCIVLRRYKGEDGQEVASVDTDRPWGILSVDGTSQFDVLADNLVEVPHAAG